MVSEGLDSVICNFPLDAVITGCDSNNIFTSPDALVVSKRQSFRSLTLRNDISLSSATRICELLPSAINIFIAFSCASIVSGACNKKAAIINFLIAYRN